MEGKKKTGKRRREKEDGKKKTGKGEENGSLLDFFVLFWIYLREFTHI